MGNKAAAYTIRFSAAIFASEFRGDLSNIAKFCNGHIYVRLMKQYSDAEIQKSQGRTIGKMGLAKFQGSPFSKVFNFFGDARPQ